MSTTEKRQLRPFQRRVYELLHQGKNVILQAPTGAGKTDAALLPFIQNLERGGNILPRTCIYATPMRVLSTQFYEKYRTRIAHMDKERGTDLVRQYEHLEREPISIQTGEQPDDPQFESILTFCTIDQLLASFLGVPYSIDGRRLNINVGAIVGSYLVLDEFHLYPLLQDEESCRGARTTAVSILCLLKSVTRFIIMTATFSTPLLEELKKLLEAEVVTVSHEEELNIIAEGRLRTFEVSDSAMSAETVLESHDQCSLVVCNTVLRAQQLYWQIKEPAAKRGIEVILLHSRLTVNGRSSRSKMVRQELGQAPKEWSDETRYGWKDGMYYGKNLIVVATQVVEVGLDISVQTLHTEIAPANSLIQRAGRCARFAKQMGSVIIYDLPPNAEGKRINTLPYDEKLCDATLLKLKTFDRQQPISFREEQTLIDAVHTEKDRDILERYKNQQGAIAEDIFKSLNENNRGIISTLIRDVMQVQILIHDNPKDAIQTEPWRWQSFALHPDSLASRWKVLDEEAAKLGLEWVGRVARATQVGGDDADSRQKTIYEWDVIPNSGDTRQIARRLREALMIVLPSKLATYHNELGFVLLDRRLDVKSTGYQSTPLEEGKKKKFKSGVLKVQSYHEHIQGLVNAYNAGIREQMQYVVQQLEKLMGLPEGSVDQAIRLAIACHDLGKLSKQWQQWALEWQQLLYERNKWQPYEPPSPLFFFAKTDFDSFSKDQRNWQKDTKTKRPNHACESVALGIELLAESLGATEEDSREEQLLRAVCGAIARHHTPGAHEYGSNQLQQGAIDIIKEALEAARQGASWTFDLSRIELSQLDGGDLAPMNADAEVTRPKQGRLHELETWLYFVIVRALRLADQRADRFSAK